MLKKHLALIITGFSIILSAKAADAISKTELEESIKQEKKSWFKNVYEEVTGLKVPDQTGVETLRLTRAELRTFVVHQKRMEALAKARASDIICSLDPSKDPKPDVCKKDPKAHLGHQPELLQTLDLIERGLRSIIFTEHGEVNQDYVVKVDDAIKGFSNQYGDARFENVNALVSVQIPVVESQIATLLPKKPESLALLEKQEPIPSTYSRLSQYISIRRSYFNTPDVAKPAALGLTTFGHNDKTRATGSKNTVGNVNAAITWKPLLIFGLQDFNTVFHVGENTNFRPDFIMGVESDFTSGKDTSTINHFTGGEFNFSRRIGDPSEILANNRIVTTFNFKTDRKYDARIYGSTIEWTPDWHNIGWGRNLFRGNESLGLQWRVFIGLNYDSITDPGSLPKTTKSNQFNLAFRSTGAMKLFNRFSVIPEIKYLRELIEHRRGHISYAISTALALDAEEHFSFTTTYKRGEDAPTFKETNQTILGFGVKF